MAITFDKKVDTVKITEVQVDGKTRKKVRLMFYKDNPKSVGRTQQHFKDEANINKIVARYNKSGLLTDPAIEPTHMPQFGDFSNVVDFQTMQNKMVEIKDYFMSLGADIRKMFDNNPQNLMTWVQDPANLKQARELGILPRDMSNIKYIKELADGSVVDVTDEVIKNRGLFVKGKRVNKDGTLYQEVVENTVETTDETPTEETPTV